jgi:hypothetical protein
MRAGNGYFDRATALRPQVATAAETLARWRRPVAVVVGVVGVALYNWWLPVAVFSRLLTTPNELFSDLEATGRPDASLLQHLDLAAGIVMVVALLLRGRLGPEGRRSEWPWLLTWAVAGAVGGRFSYACPEGLSAACRSAEWRLALPPHHYVHVIAGIVEFAAATVAVYIAWKRTRTHERPTTRTVRWTGRVLVAAYPLLGLSYLTDRLGVFVEPIFFVCFSVMAMVELLEPVRGRRTVGTDQLAVDSGPHIGHGWVTRTVNARGRHTGSDQVRCD